MDCLMHEFDRQLGRLEEELNLKSHAQRSCLSKTRDLDRHLFGATVEGLIVLQFVEISSLVKNS